MNNEEKILTLLEHMHVKMAAMETNMATKEELTSLATKQDLKGLATKEELTSLATKQDLKSLATKEELTSLATKDDLQEIRGDISSLKANVADLQVGQQSLQGDISSLKVNVADLQEGQQSLRGDIASLYQNHEKHMKIIGEGLGHLNVRYAQLDKVERQTDDHDSRIFALEQKAANT